MAPEKKALLPLLRKFGEDVDPRADVLAPLRVVRARGVHREWPAGGRIDGAFVKRAHGDAQAERVPPDLVQGGEPVVDVQDGVLEPLRHDRPRELLPAHEEPEPLLPLLPGGEGRALQEQDPLKEVEHRRARFRAAPLGLLERLPEIATVPRGEVEPPDVGPVDGKGGRHLDEGLPQLLPGQVPGVPVLIRQPAQVLPQGVHLPREKRLHDQLLFLVDHRVEVRGLSEEPGIRLAERTEAARAYEDAVRRVQEVVPGGPPDRPFRGKGLVLLEDLLHHQVKGGVGTPRLLRR